MPTATEIQYNGAKILNSAITFAKGNVVGNDSQFTTLNQSDLEATHGGETYVIPLSKSAEKVVIEDDVKKKIKRNDPDDVDAINEKLADVTNTEEETEILRAIVIASDYLKAFKPTGDQFVAIGIATELKDHPESTRNRLQTLIQSVELGQVGDEESGKLLSMAKFDIERANRLLLEIKSFVDDTWGIKPITPKAKAKAKAKSVGLSSLKKKSTTPPRIPTSGGDPAKGATNPAAGLDNARKVAQAANAAEKAKQAATPTNTPPTANKPPTPRPTTPPNQGNGKKSNKRGK